MPQINRSSAGRAALEQAPDITSSRSASATALDPPNALLPKVLLLSYREGDPTAAQLLMEHFTPEIQRMARKKGFSVHEADDIVQETFIQVFTKADTYDESRPLKPWVMTIARRKAVDFGRRKASRRELTESGIPAAPNGDGLPDLDSMNASTIPAPERLLEQRLVNDVVREGLRFLKGVHRGTPKGAICNDLLGVVDKRIRYRDIAERHGIPLGTVKSSISSLKIELARYIKEKDPEFANSAA